MRIWPIASLLLLAGCSSSPSEMNQCAQQNFQCEQSCSQSHTERTLGHQICSNKCIDSYNQCKTQVEAFLKTKV